MEILQFSDVAELAEKGAKLCGDLFMSSPSVNEAIVLTGGNTPISMYDSIVRMNPTVTDNIHIFFSDERMVPVYSGDSNFRAAGSMLRAIKFPEDRIYRVPTELGLMESAEAYNRKIQNFLDNGGIIRLAFMGLSEQGVTASILDRSVLSENNRFMIPLRVDDISREITVSPSVDRVTATPLFLNTVERLIFLVTGHSKKKILDRFLNNPESTLAGLAVSSCSTVEVWADSEVLG